VDGNHDPLTYDAEHVQPVAAGRHRLPFDESVRHARSPARHKETALKRPIALIGSLAMTAGLLTGTTVAPFAGASSHREAPLISNDPAADTTDMYVFRSPDAPNTVTAIMNVWPFGLPEQGPNWYLFDPNVRYSMHITQDGGNTEDMRLDFPLPHRDSW
jgi:hypothetical protein